MYNFFYYESKLNSPKNFWFASKYFSIRYMKDADKETTDITLSHFMNLFYVLRGKTS